MKVGWTERRLAEVTSKINSGATPKGGESSYKDDGVPLIRSLNVHDGEFRDKDLAFIDDTQADKLSNAIVQEGDVLLNITGASVTRCCVAPSRLLPARVNQHVTIIRPIASIVDSRCLAYLLISKDYKDQLLQTGEAGATRQAITKAQLQSFQILIPPLPKQRRIVAILDDAFAGIARAVAATEKNLANARELFECYLNSIFAQRGDGWIERPFSELADIKHGFAFKSEYFADEGDYVLLTPGNFYEEGGYRDRGDKQKFYDGEIPDGFLLRRGAFLIAMTEQAAGLLGSSIIVPEDNRFLHNQRLGLVEPRPTVAWCNEFFFHAFNTRQFRKAVHDDASGVKVRHTSPKKMGRILLAYPPTVSEQARIADRLDGVLAETQRLETLYRGKLAALAELKQSLLQKAFSGQLTAKGLDEDAAA